MSDKPSPLLLELYRRNPMAFRESILVDAGNKLQPLGLVMAPVQREDFEARTDCMLWTAKVPMKAKNGKLVDRPRPLVRKFYTQRSRGYSKTSDIALDLIWLLLFATYKMDGLLVAEDLEQAQLILVQAGKILDVNPWLLDHIELQKKAIISRGNGSLFKCIASDVTSGMGLTSDVVIADEFSAWSQEGWWGVTFSTAAKRDKLLIVGANALATGSWQQKIRQSFIDDPTWHCSIPKGYAPWYAEDTIQSQRAGLEYSEFQRLWMNIDADTGNVFIEQKYVDAAVSPELQRQETGSEHVPTYICVVDYAERIDRTVITVMHLHSGTVIVDRMDVIDPQQRAGTILVTEVLERLDAIDTQFGVHSELVFVFDKWQMAHAIQVCRGAGKLVEEFEFQSGIGNHQASVLLQQYLMEGKVKWYEGCGQLYDEEDNVWVPQGTPDDLNTELSKLIITSSAQTKRWRFNHPRGGHDDRAFTLAAGIRYVHNRLIEELDGDIFDSEEV